MPTCVAIGCKTRRNDKTVSPPVTIHHSEFCYIKSTFIATPVDRFPSDEALREKWILALGRKNWKPTKRSSLCSKHFTEDCFDRSEFYSKLNKGAVPTIFPPKPVDLLGVVIQPSIQEPEVQSADDSLPPPPQKKLKATPKQTAEELLGMAAEYFNSSESEWEVMAKGWALKLGKLAPDQRLYAEKIINDTLFEAQMGTLTRNGVRFLPDSQTKSE